MLDLIIKNGECYINGNLEKKDIGILNNKIVEIGPSKTLTNMMKRFKLDLKTINIESIDDIKNYD